MDAFAIRQLYNKVCANRESMDKKYDILSYGIRQSAFMNASNSPLSQLLPRNFVCNLVFAFDIALRPKSTEILEAGMSLSLTSMHIQKKAAPPAVLCRQGALPLYFVLPCSRGDRYRFWVLYAYLMTFFTMPLAYLFTVSRFTAPLATGVFLPSMP